MSVPTLCFPFQGLEHLMHNLGLGGLEFSPTHTVDEHRPSGYKSPDIVLEEKSVPEKIPEDYAEYTSTVATSTDNTDFSVDQFEHDDDTSETNSPSQTEPNYANRLTDDMWNIDLWQKHTFKDMHDPKHRHPRHHGKQIHRHCLN